MVGLESGFLPKITDLMNTNQLLAASIVLETASCYIIRPGVGRAGFQLVREQD